MQIELPELPLYWFVGGDTSKAYSLDTGDYVLPSDPTYAAYVAAGKHTQAILNEQELGEVVWVRKGAKPVPAGIVDGWVQVQVNAADKALAKTMFDIFNQVRALQSNPPVTWGQFVDYVKNKAAT